MLRHYALIGSITLAACATEPRNGEQPRPVQQPQQQPSGEGAGLQMEQQFLRQATSGNRFEIESSQLALERGVPRAYQDFAELMIRDHTQLQQQVQSAAEAKGINLMSQMMPRHQDMLESLRQMQGDEFVRTYEMMQDRAHREAIQLHRQCAQNCQDRDIRQLAASAIPVLESHVEALQSTSAQAMLPEEEPGFEEELEMEEMEMETPDIR